MKRPNWKEAARQYHAGERAFHRDLLAVAEHLNPFSYENECGTFQLADVAKRVVEKLQRYERERDGAFDALTKVADALIEAETIEVPAIVQQYGDAVRTALAALRRVSELARGASEHGCIAGHWEQDINAALDELDGVEACEAVVPVEPMWTPEKVRLAIEKAKANCAKGKHWLGVDVDLTPATACAWDFCGYGKGNDGNDAAKCKVCGYLRKDPNPLYWDQQAAIAVPVKCIYCDHEGPCTVGTCGCADTPGICLPAKEALAAIEEVTETPLSPESAAMLKAGIESAKRGEIVPDPRPIPCCCASYTPNLHGQSCAICSQPYPDPEDRAREEVIERARALEDRMHEGVDSRPELWALRHAFDILDAVRK